jgi:staphyloferrin B synthase
MITKIVNLTAEQIIMKDLINAFIAERLFQINEHTTTKILNAPTEIQNLYKEYNQGWIYLDEICFLIENSYRQGYQWITGSNIYRKEGNDWVEISSPLELCQIVLRQTLSEEYAQPAVKNFLEGLQVSIEQLKLSMEQRNIFKALKPTSPFEWFIKGEMISSLRDRPFHPLSKAKIGFTKQDYQNYMAEFGKETTLCWVAIRNESIVKGCPDNKIDCLDVLKKEEKEVIEQELKQKHISKEEYTIIPVHPWQLDNIILPNFKEEIKKQTIILLNSKVGKFLSTSSVRSLLTLSEPTKMLKLPISVMSLGAARYLPVVKLLNGIAGENMFRQALACDETLANRVFLCEEKNWWGYMPKDMGLFDDHPRHLAAQIRIYPQEIIKNGYKIIPMSALGIHLNGQHFLDEILEVHHLSKQDVIDFYTDLATVFYDITMRLFKIGIVPEIHGQNSCIVMKKNKIKGLLFRDHDSVRLHQPYLDKHRIKDPKYHIRPGYSNTLYNETIEKLIFYIQSLGTQVNLASIMESLSEVYNIPEGKFWNITEMKLREALQTIDIPEVDREKLHYELFERKEWPVKLIIRPLLEAEGVPGAMPSGKGIGYNPFYKNS